MNGLARAQRHEDFLPEHLCETELNGVRLLLDPLGGMVVPEHSLLCVSDLHLEKGAAFARRGQMLPPWDTLATLRLLQSVIERHDPRIVISLGDNFHDRRGADLMPPEFRALLESLMGGREWIWISGNHDPDGVGSLPGVEADILHFAGLTFRHEPQLACSPGEVAGHLHPAATLVRRQRGVRRPCFAMDQTRMIMPSFGVMTGGLDLDHRAFKGLFARDTLRAHMLSQGKIHSFAYKALKG
jgi:DNA ligase-associated metallophosphoesterase